MNPSVLFYINVHLLYIVRGYEGYLLVTEARDNVVCYISAVPFERGCSYGIYLVFGEPLFKPLSECHCAFFG